MRNKDTLKGKKKNRPVISLKATNWLIEFLEHKLTGESLEEDKERMLDLATFESLEKDKVRADDLTLESLLNDKDRTVDLATGLQNNFLDKNGAQQISEIEINKNLKELVKINYADKNGAQQISEIEINKNLKELVKIIYAYHNYLGQFWNEYKKAISIIRNERNRDKYHFPTIIHGLGISFNFYSEEQLSGIYLDEEVIYPPETYKSAIFVQNVIRFIAILESLPLNRFIQCKSTKCERLFFAHYKGKYFCSNRCASRFYQHDLRNNPEKKPKYEKVKKKQRKRYRKKIGLDD